MPAKKNIVLISVDSLRADFCPWLGYGDIKTPALTSQSRDGVSYRSAIAPGQGTPDSMPAVFTGFARPDLHPLDGAITKVVGPHQTIANRLRRKGYETVGFSPNPYTSRSFSFNTGFDYFEDFLDRDSTRLDKARSWIRDNTTKPAQAVRLLLNILGLGDLSVSWREYYPEILTQIEQASEPFFLWVFLLEPHWPYIPSQAHRDDISYRDLLTNIKRSRAFSYTPSDSEQSRLRRVYERTILDVDDFVRALIADLADYDPMYFFHSDHGESLGEHGNWGHKGYLYPENVRVPLEVWNTGTSRDITHPISLRKVPKMINSVANGGPTSWDQFCEPVVDTRLDQTEHAIYAQDWYHYSDGNSEKPESLAPICRRICRQNNIKFEQLQALQSAVQEIPVKERL